MYVTMVNRIITRKRLIITASILVLLALLAPIITSAYAGLGGYISEKNLREAGGTLSSLFLNNVNDGPIVLATIPTITTVQVDDQSNQAGGATATLTGNLADLNGMPLAECYFIWGYSAATMVNTTVTQTVVGTGNVTQVIVGWNPSNRIFYQFYGGTDAETSGAVMSFAIPDEGAILLRTILLVIIALVIVVNVLYNAVKGRWVLVLMYSVIGIIGFVIAQIFLDLF